jgi:serine/threonine-protein kinase
VFSLQGDGDGRIAEAFHREAESSRRLDHPDIVRTLASGLDLQRAYLALEFVPGSDLEPHTRAHQLLPVPDVLRTVERVARALAAAHALGIVHRDIKPGNVLVHAPSDTVKLTDFGLARIGDAFRSRTGMMAGTPVYMSPEQLAETSLDARSDLYSLGVLLFQLLVGRLPYQGASLGALLRRVASEAAPAVTSLRPELSPPLADLVAQLIEKEPARRPGDALTLADRLAQLRAAGAGLVRAGPKSRGA